LRFATAKRKRGKESKLSNNVVKSIKGTSAEQKKKGVVETEMEAWGGPRGQGGTGKNCTEKVGHNGKTNKARRVEGQRGRKNAKKC